MKDSYLPQQNVNQEQYSQAFFHLHRGDSALTFGACRVLKMGFADLNCSYSREQILYLG